MAPDLKRHRQCVNTDNKPEESNNNTDLIEDSLDMEEKETEEVPRDTTVYSKDNLANEIILRYNKQNTG